MKRFVHCFSLCLTLVLLAGTAAQAGTLNFKLTASQQGLYEEETSPNLIKSTILRFKMTSKEILQLLATHYAMTFPTGSAIFIDSEGAVSVRNKNGDILLAVEETVLAVNAISYSLLADTDKTTSNGGGNYVGNVEFLGAIDLNAHSETDHFYISGASRDRFTTNYKSYSYTYSWSIKAAGDGILGGLFVLITGSADEKESGFLE